LEHPFLQDLTSPTNDQPCSVIENQNKVKNIKKKPVYKNTMEDIPEEEININDDMEIKDQNHAQVHQNAEQASTATPQSIQNKQLEEKKQETKTEIRSSDFCTQVTNISIEPNKRESTVGR
jgi:hypothetical protein